MTLAGIYFRSGEVPRFFILRKEGIKYFIVSRCQCFLFSRRHIKNIEMGIAAFLRLEVDVFIVRKPPQSSAIERSANSWSSNPSFIPLAIQRLQFSSL